MNYLQYLKYWKQPQYAKYIVYVLLLYVCVCCFSTRLFTTSLCIVCCRLACSYPHALAFLDMLEDERFRQVQ